MSGTHMEQWHGTTIIGVRKEGRTVIAGDIHTSSINGFMHGIKRGGG